MSAQTRERLFVFLIAIAFALGVALCAVAVISNIARAAARIESLAR